MALYNKMRPLHLGAVKGQDEIVRILQNNVKSNNLPNAMLFVGTRGVGKTSIAKVFSRMINCEHPLENGDCCNECPSCKAILSGTSLDVLELDAASNNGVDDVRKIIENIRYKPIGKMKVLIADEVHMFSIGAWNALLKIMEEPPKNVIFILCTTELHKVPATIISRCRKFTFKTISVDIIVEKLKEINDVLHKKAEEEALYIIAKAANGSMRDAESIYEAFIDSDNVITASFVRETLGFTAEEHVFSILDAIISANPVMATSVIEDVFEKGGSLNFLLEECMRTLMDIISLKMNGDITEKGNSAEYVEKITEYAFGIEMQRLFEISDAFCKTYGSKSSDKMLSFQAMLIQLACTQSTITDLLNRVEQLERTVEQFQHSGSAYVVPDEVSLKNLNSTVSYDNEPKLELKESHAEDDITEDFSESSVSSEFSSNENSTSVVMSGDDELRALGLNVVDATCDFDEESLDDSMLEVPSQAQTKTTEALPEYSTQSDTRKETLSDISESEDEASFFDDFARLFE